MCQTSPKVSICLFESITTVNCSQVKTFVRMDMQMSFAEAVSNNFWKTSLVMQKEGCISCPCGCSQVIWQVSKLNVEIIIWDGCEVGWMFSETTLSLIVMKSALVTAYTCNLVPIASPHPHPFKTQNSQHRRHCFVIKLYISEWPFIVTSLRHTCETPVLFNKPNMPDLSGRWIIFAKRSCT